MSRHKLRKFAEAAKAENVFINPFGMKGLWCSEYFHNENPIILELGCGRGEYTLSLARRYPAKNFIGIDIKSDRLAAGAKIARQSQLPNVAFIRIYIEDLIDFFSTGEVSEIWITFPDPFERPGKAKRRLTAPRFLNQYKEVLSPNGLVHFKSDHTSLYEYTLAAVSDSNWEIIEAIADLYATPLDNIDLTIQTTFERKHLAVQDTIKYIRFKLKD